jgi:hypothetical protein
MPGRPRKHPINDSIKLLKDGDRILVRKRRTAHLIEMSVKKMQRLFIIAFFGQGKTEKKYVFSRITGHGHETEYYIVACGEKDIAKFRKDFGGGKRVRKSIVCDLSVEPSEDSASLPVNSKLRDLALIVGRRIVIHFGAGQFDACIDIIQRAKVDHEARLAEMKHALQVRGVGVSLSVLDMPTKLVNSLERFGIHTVDALCHANRDYLLDHVPQFNKRRLNSLCKLLDRLGFEHELYEPEYYKAREQGVAPVESEDEIDAAIAELEDIDEPSTLSIEDARKPESPALSEAA